jgi:L-2-hydroxyglutarate oxidase LhgO
MSEIKVSAMVIGAGVVGCAVAYRLAEAGFTPWVIEAGPRIAEGVTSRNSGVVHSGIYYPPGSVKARSCIRGQVLLYEWCAKMGVSHRKTAKWIVAPKSAEEVLRGTYENALASGARGVRWVHSRSELQSEIPHVEADVAIHCLETGIVDPFEYTRSFQFAAEGHGAEFVFEAPATTIERLSSGNWRVETARGVIETSVLINSAGLHADDVARMAGVDRYRLYPWRGDYFRLRAKHRYDSLIYPVKPKGSAGLGVHLTLGLDGSCRLGPDARVVDRKDDFGTPENLEERKRVFFESARIYLKDITLDQLEYDSCGIRPKLRSPSDTEEKDFVLSEDLPGLINLVGIESPGLTASADLADRVLALLKKDGHSG